MHKVNFSFLAGSGSAILLLAAFTFQMLGYAPCHLCILQRWPHLIAVLIAVLIGFTGWHRGLALIGLVAAGVATGLAVYHSGVELGWWEGPVSCTGGLSNLAELSASDLMAKIEASPVVRCDEISWRFTGLSMANWNAILSAVLTVIWAVAVFRPRQTPRH